MRRTALLVAVIVAGLGGPAPAVAQGPMMPPSMPMPGMGVVRREAAPTPFYRERTFLLLVGAAATGAGVVAYRVVRRRRAAPGPVARSQAVLVVDLVESTHLATHYGDVLGMRARNALKERALEIARGHGLEFAENTGDGYVMTFPAVPDAVQTATELMRSLRERPPDLAPAPPIAARAGIAYGEILVDGGGSRHGAAINKAFRLVGLSRESFTQVEGEEGQAREVPDRDRILLDEEAAQELRAAAVPRRFVGFCSLKGFSGLHRVYAIGASGTTSD